jgi:Tol biopolymer transport system component/DNA-binding winged helix-turn-helix (wHTH) protein
MEPSRTLSGQFRFGVFEADLGAGELRKHGRKVVLQGQPFQVLSLLLRHHGEIVAREALQRALWPTDTFIEFEHGINTAIKKLRQALGDTADNPRFIETLPRKGYRFIAPVESPAAAAPAPAVRLPRRWVPASAGLIAIAAGCVLWLVHRAGNAPAGVPVPAPLTAYPGYAESPSFSPAGDRVAFSWDGPERGNTHIYVKRIGEEPPVRLTNNTADDQSPVWSPDGHWVAFVRSADPDGGVFRIPATGGAEQRLNELPAEQVSWHPGGRWLVVSGRNSAQEPLALFLLSIDSGEKLRLTSPPNDSPGDVDPAVSPDGRAVVFARSSVQAFSELYLLELSESLRPMREPKRITGLQGCTNESAWLPDGNSILFTSGASCNERTLWRMAIGGSARDAGKLERLPFGGTGSMFRPAVSHEGSRLAFMQRISRAHIQRLQLAGSHRVENLPMNSTRVDHLPQYSPDGKRIAFGSNRSGNHEIWVCSADGSNTMKLTSLGGPIVTSFAWSPDGRRIGFSTIGGGPGGLYIVSTNDGKIERVPGGEGISSWSRDGKWIFFASGRTGKGQVWKIPAGGGAAVQVTKQGGDYAIESPDGKFVYYTRSETLPSGKAELWRVPAEGGGEIRIASGIAAQYLTMDERGVYFLSGWDNPWVRRYNFATGRVETVAKAEGDVGWGLSVSPDSQSLLYSSYANQGSDLMLVENFR